ncbi:MAG: hypothetical protein KDA60_22745, partial [Planctomycetales bacterium]|nr:hypothetical protein [Planctomycetales bacterium]
GAPQAFARSDFDMIAIEAQGGDDTVEFAGGSGTETTHVYPGYASWREESADGIGVVVTQAEQVQYAASGDNDLLILRDATGDDQLVASQSNVTLTWTDIGQSIVTTAAARVRAISVAGGNDTSDEQAPVQADLKILGDWTII